MQIIIPKLKDTTQKTWFSLGTGTFKNVGLIAEISTGSPVDEADGIPCMVNEEVLGEVYVLQDSYASYKFNKIG